MMSIVSVIQSGEETSINVLLRTLKKFSVGTVTCTINAAMLSQSGVKTLFFYPRIWKNLRQTTFVAGNQKMRTH